MNEIWDALHQERIEMHYQPQYDLTTGEIMGAEAGATSDIAINTAAV